MIIPQFLIFCITCFVYIRGSFVNSILDSDADCATVSMEDLVNKYGYHLEEHEVETEDGYILTLFRIVENNVEGNKRNPIAYVVHGIHTHSDIWALHDQKSLPILLVKDGYDVWLGNTRGNKYSQSHKYLSAKRTEFWDHSWHEVGIYDLPASIDYILDKSGNEKLSYIGYSTGTSAFFVMLSEKPEYNDKISAMVAYAPIAYTKNMRSPTFKFFSLFDTYFLNASFKLSFMDIVTSQGPLIELTKRMCVQRPVSDVFCYPFFAFTLGPRSSNETNEMLQCFIKDLGASSLKQIVHFTQLYSSKKFQKFNYSSEKTNLEKYGSTQPTEYNLKNSKIPVALFTVPGDYFVSEEDVNELANTLPNVILNQQVPLENYGFLSYLLATDAPEVLYQPTVNLLRNITSTGA